jgi:Flp pilus assembly protein TadG
MSLLLHVNLGQGETMGKQELHAGSSLQYQAIRRLIDDKRGTTAAEFALVIFVFSALILNSIDLSRQIWEINLSKTAVREGARLAAVRPIVSTWLNNLDPIATGLVAGNGDPIPVGTVATVTCSGATSSCTGGSNTAMNMTVFGEILARMRVFNPQIQAANVVIIYRHVGLGFAGNPFGPDTEPEISISLTGLNLTQGALSLLGVQAFTMPPLTTTISSEDLS